MRPYGNAAIFSLGLKGLWCLSAPSSVWCGLFPDAGFGSRQGWSCDTTARQSSCVPLLPLLYDFSCKVTVTVLTGDAFIATHRSAVVREIRYLKFYLRKKKRFSVCSDKVEMLLKYTPQWLECQKTLIVTVCFSVLYWSEEVVWLPILLFLVLAVLPVTGLCPSFLALCGQDKNVVWVTKHHFFQWQKAPCQLISSIFPHRTQPLQYPGFCSQKLLPIMDTSLKPPWLTPLSSLCDSHELPICRFLPPVGCWPCSNWSADVFLLICMGPVSYNLIERTKQEYSFCMVLCVYIYMYQWTKISEYPTLQYKRNTLFNDLERKNRAFSLGFYNMYSIWGSERKSMIRNTICWFTDRLEI